MMPFGNFVISADTPPVPCRGCEKRRVGCHATGACAAYDEFRAAANKRYEANKTEKSINDYVDERIRKTNIQRGRCGKWRSKNSI